MRNLKLFSGTALSALSICFIAQAQKLPNVQQIGLRAPAQIKIDGRTTEWNNQLQAYNKATGIYYALCNDDENLYLTLQAKDPLIVRKLLMGGLVFRANKSVKKDDEYAAFSFPLLSRSASYQMGYEFDKRVIMAADKPNDSYHLDSLLLLMNTTLNSSLKEIGVEGIKQFDDKTLSVYNDAGIKARALFDTDNALTCELAIPVKYLNLQPESTASGFSYQVKVNGINANVSAGTTTVMVRTIKGTVNDAMKSRAENQILTNTTDFWGEYTLAKKQD